MKTFLKHVGPSTGAHKPHITTNELSKYVGASESVQRRIIAAQRRMNTGAATHYSVALPIIQLGLSCGFAGSQFEGKLHTLTDQWIPTKRGLNKQSDNIAAVNHCRELMPQLPFAEGTFVATCLSRTAAVEIAGVKVSVRPEILIQGRAGGLAGKYGAIKLYLSKNTSLRDREMLVDAVVLHHYMVAQYGESTVSRENCLVLDVFAHAIKRVPVAVEYSETMFRIEAACADIARRWKDLDAAQANEGVYGLKSAPA